MPTPGVIQYPTTLDDVVSLVEANNNASSTLTAPISVGDLLIPVAQPGKFSNSGIATLTDSLTAPTKIELFIYNGKSGSNLVVPLGGRGQQGTTAQAFSTGNFVEQRPTARYHTALAEAIIALQTKLGVGANTPGGSAQALFSDASGASLWRAIAQADVSGLVTDLNVLDAAIAALEAGKQPIDGDLTAIAALNANGFLRKVAGVWQMNDPTIAWSANWFIPDPSTALANTENFQCAIIPDGRDITVTKLAIKYGQGSHTGGTSVAVTLRRRGAAFVDLGNVQLNDTNSALHTVYTADIVDTPLVANDILTIYFNRTGTPAERDVSVAAYGFQRLL
jgi:hypothetical protein